MFKKLVLNVCCLTMVAAICTPAVLATHVVNPEQTNTIVEPKKEQNVISSGDGFCCVTLC